MGGLFHMKKQKTDTSAPWAVKTIDLINWVKDCMPVRYKREVMYLSPGSYTDVVLTKNQKKTSHNKIRIFDPTKQEYRNVDIDDVTLLIR